MAAANIDTNPDTNDKIKDGPAALRASPDAENAEIQAAKSKRSKKALSKQIKEEPEDALEVAAPSTRDDELERGDPEAEGDEDADPEELQAALSRPPPVNSPYLPLPWKGRLGYACLNTYLRAANPPVFSSRTCRIASILEHRHPLKDPSQPEHATKNRPDKTQPADVGRGQAYVEALGLANAQDIPKMLRWNNRYGIKFFRLSSEMFPFASHDIYGYKLKPFAAETLGEAGRVAAELGHRLTTHPGQFTQLGSPRKEVITASLRDLEYHCELLDLLKLPPQQNRDAIMVLHMGGAFGDKAATIARFKENYLPLSQGIKNRLVLENDDVIYSVHDLLPVCEELNIPLVLDFHHHNIIFDADKVREGTFDIMPLFDRIKATWTRKNITQKMHYSEPTPQAITARQRRKHNPRPATLPPCPPDMDLMIEAKDKEQAVFELMHTFKLPGYDSFAEITPYVRTDENKASKPPKKPATPKKKQKEQPPHDENEHDLTLSTTAPPIPSSDLHMGGPLGRVYWPPTMEEYLRPRKRETKPRDPMKARTTAERAALKRAEKAAWQAAREASAEGGEAGEDGKEKIKRLHDKDETVEGKQKDPARAPGKTPAPAEKAKAKAAKAVLTPSDSASSSDLSDLESMDVDLEDERDSSPKSTMSEPVSRRRPTNRRGVGRKVVNYAEGEDEEN